MNYLTFHNCICIYVYICNSHSSLIFQKVLNNFHKQPNREPYTLFLFDPRSKNQAYLYVYISNNTLLWFNSSQQGHLTRPPRAGVQVMHRKSAANRQSGSRLRSNYS